jgi:hypothetical protein
MLYISQPARAPRLKFGQSRNRTGDTKISRNRKPVSKPDPKSQKVARQENFLLGNSFQEKQSKAPATSRLFLSEDLLSEYLL